MALISAAPLAVAADSASAPAKKDFVLPGDITVGTQVSWESDGDAPKVLVRAEYKGYRVGTHDPQVTYRYFWVKASIGMRVGESEQTGGEKEEAGPNSVNVTIVPATKMSVVDRTTSTALRFAPIDIRRSVDIGIDSSLTVQAIGFMYNTERPLAGHTITGFANLAVDLLGLRLVNFAGQTSPTVAAQLGVVSASGGLSWNLEQSVSLRLSIGGKENLAVGAGFINETDLYGKFEILLKHAHQRYSLWTAAGHYDFRAPSADVHYGETYLIVGLTAVF